MYKKERECVCVFEKEREKRGNKEAKSSLLLLLPALPHYEILYFKRWLLWLLLLLWWVQIQRYFASWLEPCCV